MWTGSHEISKGKLHFLYNVMCRKYQKIYSQILICVLPWSKGKYLKQKKKKKERGKNSSNVAFLNALTFNVQYRNQSTGFQSK